MLHWKEIVGHYSWLLSIGSTSLNGKWPRFPFDVSPSQIPLSFCLRIFMISPFYYWIKYNKRINRNELHNIPLCIHIAVRWPYSIKLKKNMATQHRRISPKIKCPTIVTFSPFQSSISTYHHHNSWVSDLQLIFTQ